jgi:hypothetical protein
MKMNERLLREWVKELLAEKRGGVGGSPRGEPEVIDPEAIVNMTMATDGTTLKKMFKPIAAGDIGGTIDFQSTKGGNLRLKPKAGKPIDPAAFEQLVKDAIDATEGMKVTKELGPSRANPSGTYNSVLVSNWTDNVKFHVVLVTGKSAATDPDTLPGKMLGIMAEYATIQGLGGTASFAASLTDSTVGQFYDPLPDEGKAMAEGIYNEMVICAQTARADIDLPDGTPTPGNVTADSGEGGTTTAAVDVLIPGSPGADIHVKFNDFDRMMGLQMDPDNVVRMTLKNLEQESADPSWPFAAKYRLLREKFIGNYLFPLYQLPVPQGKSATAASQGTPSQLTAGEDMELDMFHVPEIRAAWLAFARGESVVNAAGDQIKSPLELPLTDLIEKRLTTFIDEAGGDKSVYFFKYGTSPAAPNTKKDVSVRLEVEKFAGMAEELTVVEEPNATTTFPYVVFYRGNPVFRVETRTSGENHPPQIKKSIPDEVKAKFIADVMDDNEDNTGVEIEIQDKQVDAMIDELTKTFPTIKAGTVEATKVMEESRRYLRALIRESLLTEELTKSDKKEIEKITRKQIKRDLIDKKEITKIARKEAEAEIKKSLGKSFFGTPGKINKAIQDIAREEMKIVLKGKELEDATALITKRVLHAFYKVMFNRKDIIDNIKIR